MNRIIRACALLLAIVLTLGVALQPGIGGVYAEDTNQPEQIAELTTESATEPTMELTTEPVTEPTTEPTTEPAMEPATEPAMEPTTEPATEPEMEPATEPTTEPETESATELTTEPAAESESFPWAELTDSELAAWLMDAANADTVKAILSSDSEESTALNARIEAIVDGEDTVLAQQLQEYLAALMGMDEPEVLAETGSDEYIYFDLAAGDVTIGKSTYSGWVYVNGTAREVIGTHKTENKYYVYQSTDANKAETGYATDTDLTNKNCRIPVYSRVQNGNEPWTKFVTNNTDVKAVSNAWAEAAPASGRTGTSHYITFASASDYTADVTIDNIWSTYHVRNVARTTGGITAHLGTNRDVKIALRLKGDNRVGNVHYYAEPNTQNQIIFSNGEDADQTPGSGEDKGETSGSITVADFPGKFDENYWCSAIGGNDNGYDPADGIVIDSGVIYAGTTSADDCTAIGGGGNEFGRVTITGGIVTAVTASTGTAIGGGIGWGGLGGDAKVDISGGTVYAYNHGIGPDSGNYVSFVPAVAIGGGSASTNNGNTDTEVNISGGTVYAQSVAGAAIGGGGSGTKTGGRATIDISGGTVIAKSVGGTVHYNKNNNTRHTEQVSAGVSIGGGTGNTGGGSVTLNVSGENTILRTGSIGGGKVTGGGNIGSANVTISNGDITGQVIMAGGASKNCSFIMSGGRIHDTNVIDGNTINEPNITDPNSDAKIQYIQKDGGAVWMEDTYGETTITGGTIEKCTAKLGGAIFMQGGTFTLSGDGTLSGNTAKQDVNDENNSGRGGAVFIKNGDANVNGGSLSSNTADIRGGGLCVNGGNVHITDGLISGNTAKVRGGGVYLTGGGFTMTGGEISGNTANYRGGGIFLTKAPTLTAGTISGNKATDSGGGLCINGDKLELTSAEMRIFGNNADKGGGVAVLNGDFILSGGAVGVEKGTPNTAQKGGGVYVEAESTGGTAAAEANVTVNSGNIWYNEAEQGGGVYLAKGEGDFTLDGENASVSHNNATNGGGIYLYKDPLLNQGRIEQNTATENGGGMYISDCRVNLNPTGAVSITNNQAVDGAGIYIHDSSGGSGDSGNSGNSIEPVDAVTRATENLDGVGLIVPSEVQGTVDFTNNIASGSGGAVCVDTGRFYMESNHVTITGNQAVNGGGVAVLKGNFTMTDGSIGTDGGANIATNGGGGVYVSGGEAWIKGGSVQYNTATDGGGVYVTGTSTTTLTIRIVMLGGSINNNTATENGGGGYVAGNFRMLGGIVGGAGGGNSAKNGGGVYVSEGNVYVIDGEISNNHASVDGGGFHVSADNHNSEVLMLSGSLSHNQAAQNGGGMAVRSSNSTTSSISVEIGCLLNHNLQNGSPTLPINYEGAYEGYANFDGKDYQHNSCPEVKGNNAGNIGGGFYMNSDASTLSFYCVEESGNTAAKGKENSEGMDVEGGTVIIGDEYYHNHIHDDTLGDAKHVVPWGYISMDNATLVNGGKVDIYGDMTNPVFRDEVTVDIEDVDKDHFMDHRRAHTTEKSYKVHYIENFFGTGLYQAFQYDEGNTVITIEGALYNRPGYQILGWCTESSRTDEGAHYYEVGRKIDLATLTREEGMGTHSIQCDICGENEKDANLLELYAIWEANGYTVHFDANVPAGDTYTGSMEDQIFNYDEEKELTQNAYEYPGYIFQGWSMSQNPTDIETIYEDEAMVKNLTEQNGTTVTLYAQWKKCDHKDSHRWSYDVVNGNTLRRICDCGGQTLTATLSAENTTYDGHTHPATLTLDDKAAWGDDAPTVQYEREWLKDGLNHDGQNLELHATEGTPFHAGVYTASITKPDEKSGNCPQTEKVTAKVEYTIAKADQEAPEKPEYKVEEDASNNKQVVIQKLAKDPNEFTDDAGYTHKPKAEYCLTRYSSGQLEPESWQSMSAANTLSMPLSTAYTNYIVAARYEELNDYNASDITRADSVYFFAGNVEVWVYPDDGISYDIEYAKGENTQSDGVTLTLTTDEERYYLVGGNYDVKATIQDNPPSGTPGTPTEKNVKEKEDSAYSITDIPNNSILTITIGTTRKKPVVTQKIAPKQVFSSFTGVDPTIISRDSAFTAAFQIDNFDPFYEKGNESYGAYNGLNLNFGSSIPKDSTVILLDRSNNGEKTYWYYRVGDAAGVTSVPLTAFKKMGGGESETYSIPQPATENGYVNLRYQFIVDFSQSAGFSPENSLEMTLEAEKKDAGSNAPEIKPEVTVSMANSTFSLAQDTGNSSGLTNSFTCNFTAGAAASKWDNRASALVLTPETSANLPPDARIKAEVDGGTTYLYKSGDSFIIPLSLLRAKEEVKLTLESALFPATETGYQFTAEWLISPSKAGKAPMTGYQADVQTYVEVGKISNVTFTSPAKAVPSLKSTGQQRVVTSQDTLELTIKTKNLDGYTISAALLRKLENGTYSGTGWNQTNVSGDSLSVPLGGQAPGSFCLMLTVKKGPINIVMEVPYYFVIKPTQ